MISITVAAAELPITGDARNNGERVRELMRRASLEGVRLVHFPEGMLSGYAKNPIQDWSEVSWSAVREELEAICALAAELRLWVVLGSAHPLTPPHRPHNSLYVISDEGRVVSRYDKRFCSHAEITRFYSPGFDPVVVEIDGFRFGFAICIEVNFSSVFTEYEKLGVDCVLLSAYPIDSIFFTKACAHAAINCYWVSVSVSLDCADFVGSAVIGPDGQVQSRVDPNTGLAIAEIDRSAPEFDIPLNKARPWRTLAATSPTYYQSHRVDDRRSTDRCCV